MFLRTRIARNLAAKYGNPGCRLHLLRHVECYTFVDAALHAIGGGVSFGGMGDCSAKGGLACGTCFRFVGPRERHFFAPSTFTQTGGGSLGTRPNRKEKGFADASTKPRARVPMVCGTFGFVRARDT